MDQNLAKLARKYGVLSKDISTLSFYDQCKEFIPSNLQIGDKWIHQSVHSITKNGKLHINICRCSTYKQVDGNFVEVGKGDKVGAKLASDVDKVVVIISDGVYHQREMIVYERGND